MSYNKAYQHYISFQKMPNIDVLVDYYKNNLQGYDKLSFCSPTIHIAKMLDDFINLSPEDQYKENMNDYWIKIKELPTAIKDFIKDEGLTRLKTKYACAKVIHLLRIVEWHKNQVQSYVKQAIKQLPSWERNHIFSREIIERLYSKVPDKIYTNMKWSIDSIHSEIEMMKKMKLEEHFVNNAFNVLPQEVSIFYYIFDLDYTPTSQKIENKIADSGCIPVIIVLVIIAVLAQIMCR